MQDTLYRNNRRPLNTVQLPNGDSATFQIISDPQMYTQVHDLMAATWSEKHPHVSTHMYKINQYIGACLLGAFVNDVVVGAAFSIPTYMNNEPAHWSVRLAVDAQFRNQKIGSLLKIEQAKWCRANNFNAIYWSYDPLVSKNAHINITKLGCSVVDYVDNMYPDSSSPLHQGYDADRLIVRYATDQKKRDRPQPLAMATLTDIPQEHAPYIISIPKDIKNPETVQEKVKAGFHYAKKYDLNVLEFGQINDTHYAYMIGANSND